MATLPCYYTLDPLPLSCSSKASVDLCPCSSTPSRSIPQFPSKLQRQPKAADGSVYATF